MNGGVFINVSIIKRLAVETLLKILAYNAGIKATKVLSKLYISRQESGRLLEWMLT